VAASALPIGKDFLRVSVSAGSTMAELGDDPQTLLKRVDSLLYQNKA